MIGIAKHDDFFDKQHENPIARDRQKAQTDIDRGVTDRSADATCGSQDDRIQPGLGGWGVGGGSIHRVILVPVSGAA